MAFCFKRKESVSKAIRRLGRERIENALEYLQECRRPKAVHGARKDIKKVRALLRLVRDEIAKKELRPLTKLLRQAAQDLSCLRDAYIKAKTLRDLARHFKGQLGASALRHVRAELNDRFDVEMKRFAKEKVAKAVERTLRRVAKQLEHLGVSGKGWKVLGSGVKSAYSRGQEAYQTALKDPAPENFHQWRKRAKDLWYQVTLLHPVWPEQMDAMADELKALGDHLGDDHDLVVLRRSVEEKCVAENHARELEILNGLIEQRQRELRAGALALGKRFYAEKPAAFCDRLGSYWQTWRREKNHHHSAPSNC